MRFITGIKGKFVFFTFLLFLFFCIDSFAQNHTKFRKLDSLLILNQAHTQNDSAKVVILEKVYREYLKQRNIAKFEEYSNQVVTLAQKLKLRNFSAYVFSRRASYFHGKTAILQAEENYYLAIADFDIAKNSAMIAGMYLNLGALYSTLPDYAKCLEVNQKAIAIYEQLGDYPSIASCYTNLSSIYQDLGNQSQSLIYLQMALKIFAGENPKSRGVAVVEELIGSAYFEANLAELEKMDVAPGDRLNQALQHYQKSLKIAEFLDDRNITSSVRKCLGDIYNEMGQNDLALAAYQKATQIGKDLDDQSSYVDCLYALGKFYQKQGDYKNALLLFTDSYKIALESNLLDGKKNAAHGLSDTYEALKDYDKSLSFYKQYVILKDQIFNEEKEKEITRRQMQLDFGLKEKDYLYKQKITDVELQKQVLLAKQQQQQLYLKKQELALSDQEKSLQRLTFLKKQLGLEIGQQMQASKFEQAKLQDKYETSLRDKQISKQEQQIRIDWRIKVYLTIGIAFVLLIASVIYFNQRKTKSLNRVINVQKAELEQLNSVKDKIFSVVSHDMRTPVNALISFIQLLEGGNIEQEKLTRYAATLKNNLTYTSSMMENLLNWAASQMQGFNPYKESLNVHQLVNEVINSVHHHAQAKQITVKNNIAENTVCYADANMLSLIIRNLISNATKFTPRNGLITISEKCLEKELQIAVIDNGIGLSDDQLAHFNNLDYSSTAISTPGTEREKGTGLGLLLCRTFVGLMDGKINADKNHPLGTKFTISLPKELC
ncbi:tetratricopeptide repeat protein [Pedobacter petrophilus]|uniref:histidine kinase n=1 Tax=Pedobacter petrophilus TaxID=1908241 RepID=A0A7K0FW21_9SPHI|nr:tetratricopeptide repeat-containing sensor histidine kinase [Pedobacter petrophilus]MRX75797.1 tetratricopeptide repeat protein [Pedobacter petrophilus]